MSPIRTLIIWCLLAVLMTANGALRELLLVGALGRSRADVTSAILGIAIIVVATGMLFPSLAGETPHELLVLSITLVMLTVTFEFLFGHYVGLRSWTELASNYAIWRGRLWPAVLLTLAMTPFLWRHWGLPIRGR